MYNRPLGLRCGRNEFGELLAGITIEGWLLRDTPPLGGAQIERRYNTPRHFHGFLFRVGMVVCAPADAAVDLGPAQFLCRENLSCSRSDQRRTCILQVMSSYYT